MKKIWKLAFILAAAGVLAGCGKKEDNKVVILSVLEDNRNEFIQKALNEKFPDYDITVQFMETGKLAAKIKSEGKDTDCDIVLALQAANCEILKDSFVDLSDYDQSGYVDELVNENPRYLIWERFSGCVMMNEELLKEKGLEKPASYQDLLKPEYKELISMPDPKTSSTAYIFLLNLVNTWGEEKAYDYFEQLAPNVLQFTSSGSGPINALIQKEAAIGLGITYQAVQQMNGGIPVTYTYFEEGAPYDMDGYAMIDKKDEKKSVKEVFDYLYSDLIYEDKKQFSPEKIFKDQELTVKNYPADIPYGDMAGALDMDMKNDLIGKWSVSK